MTRCKSADVSKLCSVHGEVLHRLHTTECTEEAGRLLKKLSTCLKVEETTCAKAGCDSVETLARLAREA